MVMLQDVSAAAPARIASLASSARAAERLAGAFARGGLSEAESRMALAIFSELAEEAAVEVRRALAEHIKASPLLSHRLALQLARDVEAVALPILEHAKVLTDEDLLAIIAEGSTAKQRVIARRETVSEAVSGALIELGKKVVLLDLLPNDGAAISATAYDKALDTFGGDDDIQALLVARPVLPADVKIRLIRLLSEELKAELVARHGMPAELLAILARHGRERALSASLGIYSNPKLALAAARRLKLNGELTPSLLLRTLCAGQVELFGAALALLAGTPSDAAQAGLMKSGTPALVVLYQRAALPEVLQRAFQVALEEALQARRVGEPPCEARLLEGLLRRYHEVSPDGLEAAIFQLDRLCAAD
jgi:uncharacterized protein (DUF2336 family)